MRGRTNLITWVAEVVRSLDHSSSQTKVTKTKAIVLRKAISLYIEIEAGMNVPVLVFFSSF